jgi:heat shock protein HslJ
MIKFYISLIAFAFMASTSCSSHKKALADRTRTDTLSVAQPILETSEIRNPYYNVNLQLDLFQKNISFYGGNATENWKLFIKKDSSFTFELNGKKTVFEFSKETQEDAGIRYHSKKIIETTDTTQQKKITIIISKQVIPESSGMSFLPFFVTVTIEEPNSTTTYSGGGFYISNPALNDIWVLDSLNNEKADTAAFSQGLPRLEFHLDGGKVYGFSGCNELTGTYYTIQNEISINPLASTMKFCVGTTGENSFLEFLNKKGIEYRITNLRLILMHRDKTKLVFKKAD